MLVPEHVALPGQRLVALPATEVAAVPVLVHRLRVLATENQLETRKRKTICLDDDFYYRGVVSLAMLVRPDLIDASRQSK